MRRAKREQSPLEGVDRFVIGDGPQGLTGDRLDHGQGVLQPMSDLAVDDPLLLFGTMLRHPGFQTIRGAAQEGDLLRRP